LSNYDAINSERRQDRRYADNALRISEQAILVWAQDSGDVGPNKEGKQKLESLLASKPEDIIEIERIVRSEPSRENHVESLL
jgi:hypothetical protein